MTHDTTADIDRILEAVHIESPTQLRVADQTLHVPSPQEGAPLAEIPLVKELARAMYRFLYCRAGAGGFFDDLSDRGFVGELSRANSGRGTWESGWVVEGPPEGNRLPVHKDGLTLWVLPGQMRSKERHLRRGMPCRVQMGKELRELLPGFYTILGDGDVGEGRDEEGTLVRFYWHLRSTGAVDFVRRLTSSLNGEKIPFRAKVVSSQNGYPRADAGVLYLGRRVLPRVLPLLPSLHEELSTHLNADVPLFTRPMADGLGIAEDPGTEESFGQHRCRLVTEALWQAFTRGLAGGSRRVAVDAALVEAGLDVRRLHLQPGSTGAYPTLAEVAPPLAARPAEAP